ncbi:CD209 antigen-like protein C [Carassius carassius]|uniref:CD209 antigen-like protein C n=1 Tax=Carassius carassius TaxID=217509 RepID=UPI002868D102|nr:CD209 antigen-like protein C [Carassius carassius]
MSGIVNDGMDKGSIMDSEDRTESIVDIYASAEAVRDMKHKKETEDFNTEEPRTPRHREDFNTEECQTPRHREDFNTEEPRTPRHTEDFNTEECQTPQHTVIVLCVLIYTKSTNYAQERQQLQTKINNLTEERKQLLTNNMNLTQERQQLQTKITNLTEERDQLKSERKDLLKKFADGWKCHQSSLYFISSETKNWNESRRYCRERETDLIIINNTEEQDFVGNISGGSGHFWIGLTDIEEEGRWKWVDGSNSSITSGFWASGEPNSKGNEDCALNYSPGWADFPCDYMFKWICEKNIFK